MRSKSLLGGTLIMCLLLCIPALTYAQSNCYAPNTFTQNSSPITHYGAGSGSASVALCAQAGDTARIEIFNAAGNIYDSNNSVIFPDQNLVYLFPTTGQYHINLIYDFGTYETTRYEQELVCVSDSECWYERVPIYESGLQSGTVYVYITYLGSAAVSPTATYAVPTSTPFRNPATSTPFVPSPTPAITASSIVPLETALEIARTFSGSNTDWQALYPDGFQYTFDDGIPMVLVPVGCFMMGSNNGDRIDQLPVNEQCFDEPFWIDLTEVTQADFERLGGRKMYTYRYLGESRPVDSITWFEARNFCALRGMRLPTEAEWEYAARGVDSWEYPWGNDWNANNRVTGNVARGSSNVGSIPEGASWVGALDMISNAAEWVSSLYEDYPYSATDGREADTGDRTDVQRVLRGGWWGGPSHVTAAYRNSSFPHYGDSPMGFRCARSL